MKIPFFITIDNEGDNGWLRPKNATTSCSRGLERFQLLCNKYGFKPIYLTNYEMASDDFFVNMVKKYLDNKQCEIGLHIHSWNTPPIKEITGEDYRYVPYLIDYPPSVMKEKISFMVDYLKKQFNTNIISHRAGRWAINKEYILLLQEKGIKVDCSVCPGFDFSKSESFPGKYGTNYSFSLSKTHLIEGTNILEIPMTTCKNHLYDNFIIRSLSRLFKNNRISSALENRFNIMLRPRKNNFYQLKRLVRKKINDNQTTHLEFMIHSSELYHGTNPKWKTEKEINQLYKKMDKLFNYISRYAYGCTFEDYIGKKL